VQSFQAPDRLTRGDVQASIGAMSECDAFDLQISLAATVIRGMQPLWILAAARAWSPVAGGVKSCARCACPDRLRSHVGRDAGRESTCGPSPAV
jgi:hypothetical protein